MGYALVLCLVVAAACLQRLHAATGVGGEITEIPADTILRQAQSGKALLKCTAKTASPSYKSLTWQKDGEDLCSANEGADCETLDSKYKIGTNQYDLEAAESPLKYALGGSYTCSVVDKNDAVVPLTAKLTIVGDPVCPATFVSSLEEGTVTINCTLDYSGPEQPDLTMKDSTPEDAPGLEVKKGSTGTDGKITLTATATIPAKTDATYTCSSGVTGGVDCTIKVAPATIGSPPEGTSALVGTSADLKCTVIADRVYTGVQWQHETNKIGVGKSTGDPVYESKMDTKYTISTTTRQDLNVKNVTKDVAGKYQCSVNPPDGLEKYSAELIAIKEKPACSKKDKELTCIVSYAGNKQPIIEWYKADTVIPDLKPTASKDGDYTAATLKATLDDLSKKYTCKVENKGAKVVTSCEGHSSAPGLESKLYQSTLLSLLAMWLYNKMA